MLELDAELHQEEIAAAAKVREDAVKKEVLLSKWSLWQAVWNALICSGDVLRWFRKCNK